MAPSPDDDLPSRQRRLPSRRPSTTPATEGFRVSLGNFDGPFDLLLNLISKHELDITEVSLSKVTDEFIAYLRDLDPDEELEQASEFLVVAVTLLDMKVAGLLPQGELVDAESVALLEARDLLFARLLQYRAFKEVSAWFARAPAAPRTPGTRAPCRSRRSSARRVPELVWTLTPDDFAALALLAMTPREIPHVGLDHLHAPLVSIREQAAIVVTLLRGRESLSFRELIAGVRRGGRRRRALPVGARAVPPRRPLLRAARAAGRADPALDRRALVRREPRHPGSRL